MSFEVVSHILSPTLLVPCAGTLGKPADPEVSYLWEAHRRSESPYTPLLGDPPPLL